jgi:DNA (cytosine-5)-methyltransferase 1
MTKLRVLDLFSGIGGFSLGLERTGGFETVAFCEIELFPQRILKKHWPEVPCHSDVRTITGVDADVITGGFPCQDISTSGSGDSLDGERSGLWFEMLRIIGGVRPRFVIVENSPNLLSGNDGRWMGTVLGGLAAFRYDAEWHVIPAAAVGAPHKRERVWIIAYPVGFRQPEQGQLLQSIHTTPDAYREADQLVSAFCEGALPFLCGGHDGHPEGLDALRALGNAVVPSIPETIGRAILAAQVGQ